jgi:hypothetical protein
MIEVERVAPLLFAFRRRRPISGSPVYFIAYTVFFCFICATVF